ncbi:MAG TPA: GDP-fucose synthetase, partial [Treponema sp.]|nr:GDP-fucose synthetase [Treponema sp.]
KELAETVEDIVYSDVRKDGRKCKIVWDSSKPNGTPRKLCDVTRLNALGWKAKVAVVEGVKIAYDDFLHGDVRK